MFKKFLSGMSVAALTTFVAANSQATGLADMAAGIDKADILAGDWGWCIVALA